jgi:hypothetical protein
MCCNPWFWLKRIHTMTTALRTCLCMQGEHLGVIAGLHGRHSLYVPSMSVCPELLIHAIFVLVGCWLPSPQTAHSLLSDVLGRPLDWTEPLAQLAHTCRCGSSEPRQHTWNSSGHAPHLCCWYASSCSTVLLLLC